MIKKLLLLILVFLFSISCTKEDNTYSKQPVSSGAYYICTGSGAYAYHSNRSCSGLNKCKSSIISTSNLSGYSRCKICK